jgi:soluble lytic murein transglycosylase-like protein
MLKSRLLPAIVAVTFAVTVPCAALAQGVPSRGGSESRIAAVNGTAGKAGRQAAIPVVLSDADVLHYRASFDFEARGQWAAADREQARLKDKLLVGHVLAERYLSDSYHPRADELKEWLARYSDLPQAPRLEALLGERLGRGGEVVRPPAARAAGSGREDDPTWEYFSVEANRQLGAAGGRRLTAVKEQFRSQVSQGHYDDAVASFQGAEQRRLFDRVDYDELKTVLAIAYFAEGRDAEAKRWAVEAADGSGDVLPEAHWVAGLAMWRSGERAASVRHFEAVGNASDVSTWLISAGAYWAARANLAARHPELVNHWLQRAAAYPRTFYGLLARRALGQNIQYVWDVRPFTDLDGDVLLRVPGALRALALLQLGYKDRAEEELQRLAETSGPALGQAMLALANAGGMPALAVLLAGAAHDGRSHDGADYPLPDWRPAGGWSIDRALILAIARQESSFNPAARSRSGAVGLMQLMPQTARSMGGGRLSDPRVNLELGQRYIRHLLNDPSIKGNLLFLAASYNSGPGIVCRWLQEIRHGGDALLFLESIPVHETRVFVQQVMTNFWAYRSRLGQASPSLDAIAAGDWPMYDGAGSTIKAVTDVKAR